MWAQSRQYMQRRSRVIFPPHRSFSREEEQRKEKNKTGCSAPVAYPKTKVTPLLTFPTRVIDDQCPGNLLTVAFLDRKQNDNHVLEQPICI